MEYGMTEALSLKMDAIYVIYSDENVEDNYDPDYEYGLSDSAVMARIGINYRFW
jgi:hypothetical protein